MAHMASAEAHTSNTRGWIGLGQQHYRRQHRLYEHRRHLVGGLHVAESPDLLASTIAPRENYGPFVATMCPRSF